jgi:hypothetical protein
LLGLDNESLLAMDLVYSVQTGQILQYTLAFLNPAKKCAPWKEM